MYLNTRAPGSIPNATKRTNNLENQGGKRTIQGDEYTRISPYDHSCCRAEKAGVVGGQPGPQELLLYSQGSPFPGP